MEVFDITGEIIKAVQKRYGYNLTIATAFTLGMISAEIPYETLQKMLASFDKENA